MTAARRRRPAYRPPARDEARDAALALLRAVHDRDAYANLAMPALLRERGLGSRDAAFATELGYGALRWRGSYDAVLAACVDRPLADLDPPVLDVLRLGAHQLLGMRTPPHAAVGATVDLARRHVGPGASKLVNAVLRRVAVRDRDAWFDALAPPATSPAADRLALGTGHPRWVVSAFADALGADRGDELARALAADNEPARVTLAVRPGLADPDALLGPDGRGGRPGRWSPYAVVLDGGNPAAVREVRDGRAGVQDEGSQLVALALAAPPLDGPDLRWLDLCAGPGGKSALLAAAAARRGAQLLGVEVAPHRARLVRDALRRLPAGMAVVADGRRPPVAPASMDRVLVDAPCTGLGALRRRPEARWRRRPADIPGLTALQAQLLDAALDATRPGGVVGYVTCSPHVAETYAVVGDVLRRRTDVEPLDARATLHAVSREPLPDLGDGPHAQLWPHRHGTDAMFLALLRRTR